MAPSEWTSRRYTPRVRLRRVLPVVLVTVALGGVAAALVKLGDSSGPASQVTSVVCAKPDASEAAPDADHCIALEPRLVGREGPSAPAADVNGRTGVPARDPSALPDPDPRLPGGEPPPPTSSAPEAVRVGPFASAGISATGELVFGQTPWTTVAVPEGYELVCYLIGALAPTPPRLLPALQGIPDESPETHAGPDPWWTDLAEALVETVGRDRWPAMDTLLGWDSEQAALYVQQDAEGHSRVTELLTRRAAGRLATLQVVVEFDPSPEEPADRLGVDVPWGRTVRAHRGSVWAFLDVPVPVGADFDVEIASEPLIALSIPPLVAGLDTGTAVGARRVEADDGSDAIEVEVAASQGQPRFEPREVTATYTNVPVTIEVPQLGVARWRGRVPARPGKHHVQLDDGRSATLVVLASQPGPRPDPPFVRHVLAPRRLSPSTSHARTPQSLMVTWQAPGPLQGSTMTVPLVGHGAWRDGPPATGACTVDARGLAVDPSRECPWPLAEGGVRIHAAVFPAGDVDVLDLLVERCDAASDERESAPILRDDWTHGVYHTWYETLSLPVCRVRVDTRRVHVPKGGEAVLRLDDGPAGTLRVSFPHDD